MLQNTWAAFSAIVRGNENRIRGPASARGGGRRIAAFDVTVYMVSLDDAEKNRAFVEGLNAKHVVLSDPLKEAAGSHGVVALGGLYARRWTFYIDPADRIRHIDKNADVATAGQEITRTLGELEFPMAK
ncbi:MAG: redoxin domain-containing protein [Myxococcota bacterium]|nr:redoxin domain-containing protein [Myxococcota bacterium]